ncbi:MAG: hypothetical protein H0U52_15205, partial [Chloroflexi bacterium]|nr:hypothetical protein [Chloroflexota bacterium]
MDGSAPDRRAPTPTIRLAGRGRGPGAVVALVAIFLAMAWIKPWPTAAPAAPRVPAGPTARPAQPTADPLSSLRYHCQEPSGWRVYARERWGGRELRSWRTMDPAWVASGPLDPAIPVAPLGAAISELGYCSPWRTSARPPEDATVTAWRLTLASVSAGWRATPVELRATAPAPATV